MYSYPLQLPIDAFHWTLAIVPLVLLLILLVGLQWQAPEAGPIGMFVAAGIALVAFQTPWEGLAIATAKGIWDAIFILYVVWPALLLYHVIKRGGGFVALEEGIQRFSDNDLFLVLAFGWVFASFLQGIAGFGTPIAVVAPLLLVIGVRPIYAVAIPLIGHAWANMFGTLAVAWLATLQVIPLEPLLATTVETAILLWIPSLLAGVAIAWLFGRAQAVWYAMPLILVIAAIHGGVQLGLMFWDPILSAFLASTVALLALYPLSRLERYDQPLEGLENRPAMKTDGVGTNADGPGHNSPETDDDTTATANDAKNADEETEAVEDEAEEKTDLEPAMSFTMSLLPYIVLTVVAIGVLVIGPLEAFLEQLELGPPFPETETGYGLETEAEDAYNPFAPLTHPGTFLFVSVFAGWAVYRARGYYGEWADRKDDVEDIWDGLADDAVPASLAIIAFLVMAQVMDHAGQIEVLAFGLAGALPPTVYAFASGWIGFTGAFMTSSNTSSNILLAPLQQQAVEAMEGLSESSIIAGQSAGGAVGNAIAPANVVLGTGAAGIVGQEGDVLRITIPVMVLLGLLTVVLNGLALLGGG